MNVFCLGLKYLDGHGCRRMGGARSSCLYRLQGGVEKAKKAKNVTKATSA